MLLKRVVSAVVFIPLFIFLIIKGGLFFLALTCGIIAVGLIEFHQGATADKDSTIPLSLIILGVCVPVAVYLRGEYILPFVVTCIMLVVFFRQLFKFKVSHAPFNIALEIGGIFYISYLFSYVVIMRELPEIGAQLVIAVLFSTWMGDTGAFIAGRLCGRHKFFSVYSSNKSIEGFAGALVFSILAMVISRLWLPLSFLHLIILGVVAGGGGQMGDFFESMLKRGFHIKDFGKILPGHGGILDRFDSLFFTVPLFFYYTKYILRIS